MELEYFRLRQSKKTANPIKIEKIDKEKYVYKMNLKAFDRLDRLVVAYYKTDMGLEICDILQAPCLMITERLKDLFMLLEPQLQFKGIQLYPLNFKPEEGIKDPVPLYWIPYLEPTDCLHTTAKIYGTGIVEELVLRKSALEGKHILKVAGLVEEIWIISLCAAESLLRRKALAAGLEQVKVRE